MTEQELDILVNILIEEEKMSIKYRTSAGTSASNFTDLVVKVGDTLPIGTEVDYDGQTVPAGWQEVSETNLGDVVVDSIRSKNLLDTRQCVVSSGTITIHDNSNGVIDIEGTNGYYARVSVKVDLKPNTNYTIKYKGEIKSGSSDPVCAIKKLDNSTTIDLATGTGYKTITFTTTENGAYICFYATQGYNTGRIKYSEIQLEEGSTATEYKEYQNLSAPIFTVKKWKTTLTNNQYVSPYGSYGYVEIPATDIANYGEIISATASNDALAPMPCLIAKQSNGTYRIILVSNTSNKDMTVKVVHCKGIVNEAN